MRIKQKIDISRDYLQVSIKQDKQEEIEKYYKAFGWEKVSEEDDERFSNLVYITYSRDHFVDNKDALQLMQVKLEHKLNERAKCEHIKNSKSISLGLILGVLGLGLVGLGIAFWAVIWGIFVSIVGLGVVVLNVLLTRRIRAKEEQKYSALITQCNNDLDKIYAYVLSLTGGHDGK